jgi:hypothetical protein
MNGLAYYAVEKERGTDTVYLRLPVDAFITEFPS